MISRRMQHRKEIMGDCLARGDAKDSLASMVFHPQAVFRRCHSKLILDRIPFRHLFRVGIPPLAVVVR